MQAIILTPEQAALLLVANAGSNRILEPRQLQDGRLILNADILDDSYFADPSRPWASILGITAPEEVPDQTIGETGAPASEAVTNDQPAAASSSIQIVELSDADLAEPAQ
jgi:hypothetical protein